MRIVPSSSSRLNTKKPRPRAARSRGPIADRPPTAPATPIVAKAAAGGQPSGRGRLERAEPLEAVADRRELALVRFDERQAHASDVVAEQVQGRLDRDRVRLHAEELV